MTDLKTLQNASENNDTMVWLFSPKKTKALLPNIAFTIYMTALAFWFFKIYLTF